MGYRCPNCFQDFGLDKSKLEEHFSKNPECATEAWVYTDLWKKIIGIKSSEYKTKKYQVENAIFLQYLLNTILLNKILSPIMIVLIRWCVQNVG